MLSKYHAIKLSVHGTAYFRFEHVLHSFLVHPYTECVETNNYTEYLCLENLLVAKSCQLCDCYSEFKIRFLAEISIFGESFHF